MQKKAHYIRILEKKKKYFAHEISNKYFFCNMSFAVNTVSKCTLARFKRETCLYVCAFQSLHCNILS